ncbi:MAG: helix-turn-helix domain-containing protein [Janthinobacterium lividum]
MASSIYHNTHTDRQYKAATGLSIAQFGNLYLQFEPLYTPKAIPVYAAQVQPVFTNKREALFFILHYYKAYPTLQNLGIYFGISDSTASAYLEVLKPCLKAALHQQGAENRVLVKNQAAFDKHFAGVPDLVIDVTEVPIERAGNQQLQKDTYSGKKNFTP